MAGVFGWSHQILPADDAILVVGDRLDVDHGDDPTTQMTSATNVENVATTLAIAPAMIVAAVLAGMKFNFHTEVRSYFGFECSFLGVRLHGG